MLRALISQRRLLAFGGKRSCSYLLRSSQIHNYSIIRHHWLIKVGHNSLLRRIFSPFRVLNRVRDNSRKGNYAKNFYALAKNTSFTVRFDQLCWKGQNLIPSFHNAICPPIRRLDYRKGIYAKNFNALSKISYSTSFFAQLSRKRTKFFRSYHPHIFAPISRLAYAVSLSLTRFHVVPGFLGLFAGEGTSAQRTWEDGEHFQTRDRYHTTPKDGYVYLSSVLYSIREGFILIFRTVYLAILFSPAIALAPFADTFGS